ncbi:hypothetical protein DSCA_29200 [Desulfosarcina alkanivorans]|jgi:AcrR family transcriptional regulator|uniref:HTH tetR-type domain-containing protein n=1 Tax=Desulfosarcina alkanivorans TaxID=571177 RepID=A0A5K7YLB9_9BACT|nr:TetR/AcrR family transcriptional regulator [Desulfosarcina alkanivorans]BBO68990.1 hypothetical protein DSCA_29200 [Desulfosarcina alkanivorans]
MGRKSNADQRRAEIVGALFDCLAGQGHEKVSIKAIAARAGLPHGVIHYYFKSKEDIIADLARVLVDRYSRQFDRLLAKARPGRQDRITAPFAVMIHRLANTPGQRKAGLVFHK